MKRITFNIVSLFFMVAIYSCCHDQEACRQEIRQTEKDFAKMAADQGVTAAFSYYIADSGVVNAGDELFQGREAVRKHYESWKFKDVKLIWAPDFVDVSSSCDLGYTYGKYTFSYRDSTGKINEIHGIFHTVWKRQKDGTWRFVWD
jgi:ketosteroid isomerase-like protein